ncbi:MAG: hypothetical protein HUJ77_05265 [Clostridium sp.]|uniref:hypothetical protein n=1 Tax=Clostridium sp. TaxID=1506 RepID=UPI0025C0855C|nr:hypothetical protein [Clostridium sp.]MCF0147793.1 hypothetical protein [Clostridium sp.]
MFNIYRGPRYYLIEMFVLSIAIFWIGIAILDTTEPLISYLLSIIVSDLILKSKGNLKLK